MLREANAGMQLRTLLHVSWLFVAHGVQYDSEVLNVGLVLPFIGTGAESTLATAVYADLEFRKYSDEPIHEFRRSDGSLIDHYSPIPNIHPNLTRLRLHFKDSLYSAQVSAMHSVEFAYGSEANNKPPMNAVVGPVLDTPTISSANILGVFEMVQVTPLGMAEELTDKSKYPYLFRMGSSNSETGVAMWDYLEYFGWRGAHLLYEDSDYGNSLRVGLSQKAEVRRRSEDVTYFILPVVQLIDIQQSQPGVQDTVFAAEVAVARAAQQILSSFHRLIFFGIFNTDGLEVIVKKKLREAHVTAPYFQFGVGLGSLMMMIDRQSFEGHAPETFHAFGAGTDLSQPWYDLFRESWLTLSGNVIWDRLPALGLDPSKDIIGYTVEDVDRIFQSFPPPWFLGNLLLHGAFNSILRAFNAMLNDGYQPPEIHGAKLREYMQNVDFLGFGTHIRFNENQDVIKDMSISAGIGFDASNRTIWREVAIRKPSGSGAADVVPFPGSPGIFWATGEWSWTPPVSLRACPLGTTFHPSAAGDALPNSTIEPLVGTCELCPAGRFSATYNPSHCDACPGGTISDQGSSECTTCPIGHFALGGSSVCTACFAGSYGDKARQSACTSCLPGRFQNETGQLVCEDCLAGEYAQTIRSEQCQPCSPGTVAPNPGSATCDVCPAGSFQESIGTTVCLQCQPGSFADAEGLAQCSQCKPGSYQPNSSSPLQCERCPVGSYAEGASASRCEQCSSGMITLLLGADNPALCTCPPGTFMREFQVESTQSGQQVPQRECIRCNEYMEPCPGGTAPAYQRRGFHMTEDGQTVYQCMSTNACPGGLLESCPTGSSGPGCAECDDGYYWDGSNCVECTAGNVLYMLVLPALVVVVLIGTHRYGNDPIGRRHMSTISEMLVLGGLMLSCLFYFSSFQAFDVEWKEPVATIMDLAQLFSTELFNIDVSCSMTFGPSASMAFQSAIPLIFMAFSLLLVTFKLASSKLLFNTFGSIIYAMYLLLLLHGLKPFRYIVHPMADRKSILFMPFIFEHSAEHGRLIAVGSLVLLVYCIPFAALCGWASFAVMRPRQPSQRRLLLAMFRFLFYKFRPRAFFWGFCILLRNIIVGVTPSLFPESPSAGLFILSAVIISSAVATGIVWPWRTRWMNFADAGTLAYMALILNLAVNWVRRDEDSDGAIATLVVVAAGIVTFVAAVFLLRLLVRLALSGTEARARMRAAALAEEEATEKELLEHLEQYDPKVEIADAFDTLMREIGQEESVAGQRPLAPALTWMSKRAFDIKQAANIASQIRKKDYSLQHFFEDCASTFPELQLYLLTDGLAPADGKAIDLDREPEKPDLGDSSTNTAATTSSGRSGEVEKLRTFGALFAVYWICRLDMDGKHGLCFGVRPDNRHKLCEAPFKEGDQDELLQKKPWGKMTADQKRANFFYNFDWDLILDVFRNAGIVRKGNDGRYCLDDGPDGRLVALLCLTAFHDIMKCTALCPRVTGETYEGYRVGEIIQDHDQALAFILDRHPHLLPSFCSLSEKQRRWIRFTQSDMGFNAGWLVQAEGPPGIVLGKLKKAISSGRASDTDVAFYFAHFLTDLAGAEPTPFRGAEKFSVKFPPKVLQGLIGCIGTVKTLAAESEAHVYEHYLEKRWCEVSEQLGPVPSGPGRMAKLRLNCMAQHAAKPLLDALNRMNADDYHTLTSELAETGVPGQTFSGVSSTGANKKEVQLSSPKASTPLLLYYGPAWCQRVGDDHPDLCLRILAAVMKLARKTLSLGNGQDSECCTIHLAELRTVDVSDLQNVLKDDDDGNMGVLQVEKVNNIECKLVIQMVSA